MNEGNTERGVLMDEMEEVRRIIEDSSLSDERVCELLSHYKPSLNWWTSREKLERFKKELDEICILLNEKRLNKFKNM